jgi:hypothetical protein
MRAVVISILASLTLVACSDDDGGTPATTTDTGVVATDTGTPDDTKAPIDTGTQPADTGAAETSPSCTSARDAALKPVEKVSAGEVKTLDTAGEVKTLYVDASAGGTAMAASNPWIYLDLATAARVDVNDKAALTATTWDLAIKRPILRSNSGDSGAGAGGAVFLAGKSFDAVTDAEAKVATPKAEDWFDESCTAMTDPSGAIKTSFDGWYQYDGSTMKLTPTAGTWIVRGAKGALYKLEIQTYYSNPDGTTGATSARYKLRVATVK